MTVLQSLMLPTVFEYQNIFREFSAANSTVGAGYWSLGGPNTLPPRAKAFTGPITPQQGWSSTSCIEFWSVPQPVSAAKFNTAGARPTLLRSSHTTVCVCINTKRCVLAVMYSEYNYAAMLEVYLM